MLWREISVSKGWNAEGLGMGATSPEELLAAFRWMSLIVLLELVALILLKETKDQPMPEDIDTGEEFDPA
ncbi:MAG: hypothetical protein KDN20_22815 [Verrucomicrobiae bacterium]|nr:hypothetical protein [Verrucomicrobiae bacterium]